MSTITTNRASPLAASYRRKIGNVNFEISAFGNPQTTGTAEDLLFGMLQEKVAQEDFGGEAKSV